MNMLGPEQILIDKNTSDEVINQINRTLGYADMVKECYSFEHNRCKIDLSLRLDDVIKRHVYNKAVKAGWRSVMFETMTNGMTRVYLYE